MKIKATTAILFLIPAISLAQVPVDDDGNVIGQYESASNITPVTDDGAPRLSYAELQDLVGPIALYPDELLAIVLPASAYPLQLVAAARFLDALESDPSLEPDPDWDDSIVALINYPEVVTLMNDDLDWTFRLGEAVVIQQTDVVAAIEGFRDRAYAAGNLKSDNYQTVSNDNGVVSISPVAEDVIYVPYYEPSRVVYYQPQPVYYYHPRPYPVYYYPYAANHHFNNGYFWGVSTAFTIGWATNSLHTHHYSYHSHPYYGRTYWNDGWYYRHHNINVYNNTYVNVRNRNNAHHYSNGDQWNGNNKRREYVRSEGYTRGVMRDKPSANRVSTRGANRNNAVNRVAVRGNEDRNESIRFRQRDANTIPKDVSRQASTSRTQVQGSNRQARDRQTTGRQETGRTERVARNELQFKKRPEADTRTSTARTSTTRTPARTNEAQSTRRQEPVQRAPARTPQVQSAPARTSQRQTTVTPRAQPPRQVSRPAPVSRPVSAPPPQPREQPQQSSQSSRSSSGSSSSRSSGSERRSKESRTQSRRR